MGLPAGAGSLLGKRLGKYEILALLALGGTAEIYLARIGGAAGFEKYVVVKCLHDHLADDVEFVKMFLDEARLAAHLDHSNVVQTFELGEYENRYYMVMEFLAGLSLAMVVRRAGERLPGGRLPIPLTLNIIAQACAGLHYAHEKTNNGRVLNIVHRDISPQNLVVSFEGVVKVVDFGIAKAEHRETRTRSGTIKGKFAYMSPEQCVANDVDRRTDVFALGVIAHELLTGKRLFKRPSPYETYQAVIECNVPPPSTINHELDPTIDALIMKSVAKTKEARYVNAEAFGDALQSYLHHRGKGSGPGDIGRFLDEKFAIEIEEHGGRMRELIAGRVTDAGGWDEDEEEKKSQFEPDDGDKDTGHETVDVKRGKNKQDDKSMILETGDIEEMRPSEASLDNAIAGLRGATSNGSTDDDGDGDGDGDMQADRTRIETNPLERLSASDLSQNNVAPLPAPPTGPIVVNPQISVAEVKAQARAKANAKFPEAANLPTMIAEPDDEPENDPPEYARTEMAPPIVDPRAHTREQATVQLSRSMTHDAVQPPSRPSQPPRQGTPPSIQAMHAMQSGSGPQPVQPPPMMPMQPQHPPPMQPYVPNGPGSGPQPIVPNGPGSGPQVAQDSGPFDPVGAANMMSPVGDAYPQVDWAEAAAVPVRVVPPWMLALLFVGAIGVALLVTILIAKIIR